MQRKSSRTSSIPPTSTAYPVHSSGERSEVGLSARLLCQTAISFWIAATNGWSSTVRIQVLQAESGHSYTIIRIATSDFSPRMATAPALPGSVRPIRLPVGMSKPHVSTRTILYWVPMAPLPTARNGNSITTVRVASLRVISRGMLPAR